MEGNENFVGSFIQTDNVGKWLFEIFSKSALISFYGKHYKDELEKDVIASLDSYIEEQQIALNANNKRKEEVLVYTEDQKKEFVDNFNKDAKSSLEIYLKEKEDIVTAFKKRLDFIEPYQEHKNAQVAQAVKDIYGDLKNIYDNTNDVEIVKQRLEELEDKSVEVCLEEYIQTIDMNNMIFQGRLDQAKNVRAQLIELQDELLKLPNIES